jgi:hypothetical protein
MRLPLRMTSLAALCAVAIGATVTCSQAAAPELPRATVFDAQAAVGDAQLAGGAQAAEGVDDLALAAGEGAAQAFEAPVPAAPPADPFAAAVQGAALAAVADDSALEGVRGGFDFGDGLVMSLGIERLVSINGNLVSSQSLYIADVSKLSQEQARGAEALTGLKLIQNGPNNSFLPIDLPSTFGGTIIQNTLNDQDLKTQTIINSSVNSAELIKSMNFQGSVRDALSGSLSPR